MFESCATNHNGSWHRIVAVLMKRLAVQTVRIDIDELEEIQHLQIDSRIHDGQLLIRLQDAHVQPFRTEFLGQWQPPTEAKE